jgi:hypothetical protein
MQKSRGQLGISKHRKSGASPNTAHFKGKTGGKRVVRKGKGLTRKQRGAKRGTHVSKYK